MKIAFDEHVPPEVANAVRKLCEDDRHGSVEIVLARTYADPPAKSDVPWLKKYAADGGNVIITGDKKMRSRLHERAALAGFIVFFFPKAWNNWNFLDESAFLLRWWNAIVERARKSKPGDFWQIPEKWVEIGDFKDVSGKKV